jgi:hypothetical protein
MVKATLVVVLLLGPLSQMLLLVAQNVNCLLMAAIKGPKLFYKDFT